MEKQKLRIVFLGTPEFAVASLSKIIDAGYEVVGVVTAPDKPAGRGKKIRKSPVKIFAEAHGLTILQPWNLKDKDFIDAFQALNANIGVVVAFRMLPQVIWSMPYLGTFNLHASLLPDYRGAAPIHHAVMNGEKVTGVTTFFLKHEIDTGDVILQEKVQIGESETTGDLYQRLMVLGAEQVEKTLNLIETDNFKLKMQGDLVPQGKELHSAPKIVKADTTINWDMTTAEVYNKIRGLNPNPGATTELISPNGDRLFVKIFHATKIYGQAINPTGKIITDQKTFLTVSTSDGEISIKDLQLQGRKRMKIVDFLNGVKIDNQWRAS